MSPPSSSPVRLSVVVSWTGSRSPRSPPVFPGNGSHPSRPAGDGVAKRLARPAHSGQPVDHCGLQPDGALTGSLTWVSKPPAERERG